MFSAFIGLGSNLDAPPERLRAALAAIAGIPGTRVISTSSLYRSAPMGPADQPDYCNAVCQVETQLTPRDLLDALLAIERSSGRVRGPDRWGPRRLDLDLLHVEGVRIDRPGLHLPHPGIGRRNFVLIPLAEIAPALEIESVGRIAEAAQQIGREGLALWIEV
ncbi:MAG: 2-amino-4-hydroxy-6-hydroxymethyldihydropteridine diphosphokinase [Panacagrimonas sp.]